VLACAADELLLTCTSTGDPPVCCAEPKETRDMPVRACLACGPACRHPYTPHERQHTCLCDEQFMIKPFHMQRTLWSTPWSCTLIQHIVQCCVWCCRARPQACTLKTYELQD
jgi:hypothetical protein